MANKLFSVVIPYYNSISTLQRLLDSIPRDPDIEVIVADDKSTEGMEVFNALKEKEQCYNRIFVENTGNSKGVGAARNVGLGFATGKWILFADADDYFLDGAFDELRKHADSQADQIFFCHTSADSETGEPGKRHAFYEKLISTYLSDPSEENERKIRYRYSWVTSKMISHSFLKKNNLRFEEILTSEDSMFTVYSGWLSDTIEYYDHPIYCITANNRSVTHKKNREKEFVQAHSVCKRVRFLQERLPKDQVDALGFSGNLCIRRAFRMYHDPLLMLQLYVIFKKNHIPLKYKVGPFHIKL
ncbi:MAG: glycosyltransferase [Lachnospiraceae bacterium]|nr:glycosyltransferase [Lachnospiraceae bacterium]